MGRRTLTMSDTFVSTLFGEPREGISWAIAENWLPKDTRVVNAQMKFVGMGRQDLVLLLESSEWEPNEEGKLYPSVNPSFRSIYQDPCLSL